MNHRRRPIVVGLALDDASQAALTWAVRYAALTQSPVRAVHVRTPPPSPPLVWTPGFPRVSSGRLAEDDELIATMLRRSLQQAAPHGDWSLELPEGPVGPMLVEASHSALLLVIGTATHSGLERLVHGSVSHYCLTRAGCPVVAVAAGRPTQPLVDLTSSPDVEDVPRPVIEVAR